MGGRKAMVAALVALVAMVAVGFGLVRLAKRSLEAPELRDAVLREAREATGIELVSSRSRFDLFHGLALEDVTASSDLGLARYRARLDAVRLEHRPLSLLRGTLELNRLVLERPRVVLALGAPAAAAGPVANVSPRSPPEPGERREGSETKAKTETETPPPSDAGAETPSGSPALVRLALVPAELVVEDGSIAVRDETRGRDLLSVDGLHLDLPELAYDRRAVTPIHALTSRGELLVSNLVVAGLRLTGVTASLSTEGGRYRFDDLRFHADAGDLEGELEVDFNSIPFRYRTTLLGGALDLSGFAGAPAGAMKGQVRLEAAGYGTDSRNLKATGALELDNGRLPELAWLSAIDPSLPGADYEKTAVSFALQAGRISFEGLRFRVASARSELTFEGSVGLGDAADADLTVVRRVDGGEAISFRLRGALGEPELSRLGGSGGSRSAPRGARKGK
jgi:uncharacterized protein involved in outer membrane biogenesis